MKPFHSLTKKLSITICSVTMLMLSSSTAFADSLGLGISAKGSTLGPGIELDYRINENFNLRVQANGYNYSDDLNEDGIDYAGEIDLSTTGVLVDWRPFSGTFRATAGIYANGNKLSAIATDNGGDIYEIGDASYRSANNDPFSLDANIELGKSTAGYLGLGWGNALASGWMFSFELGVLFTGKPDVALAASGSAIVSEQGISQQFSVTDSSNPLVQELNNNLRLEEANLENDISEFELYPVIALGVGYRF